ncbi:hypothetical protein Moror_2134 [Moniliophthora roreri MCA 2997]|uniref:Uncharacterized protein n=1 Tax=Moniliophthora roreri (strain MCA 2997) TaxID=1381753 RepID=V2WQ49_MONRO|nr:hypothetical protein Moror_2134 [Moniliophthora roreri MCA 2997]KAI3598086.1 hypothetical protein WG66_009095 [Moniliophthora roreri]
MVRPVNPQHAAPTGASTASTSANTPSRAPARQHSGTPSKISRWELHDAPAIAKPESLDEHRQLAFRHLELSRFLFSTMLEEYPEQIPSPLKTFIQIVLETMPLDMQSIQPYMAELLRSIMLNARKNPIEVVECVNPAGPSSQPAVAYDGIAEQQIEQLHIPGSNQPSADEPFTLKQEKAPSGKTLVNLPFTVKFVPSSESSSQEPIELNIGIPDTTPSAFGMGESTSFKPPSASPPSASSSSSVHPDASELRHIKFGLGLPGAARPHPLPKEIQEPLVAAELREMRANISLPEHQKTAAQKDAEVACHKWFQDGVERHQKLKEARERALTRPLRRQNAFYGTSNPEIFWDSAWGPKPKGNSTPASQIESRGGGSGSGGPPVQFENEKEAVLDRAAGKKRAREDVLGDGEVDTKAESTDRAPKIAKSRCEETVSSIRTVASEYISSRNSRTPSPGASAAASTSNQSSVRETLKRSLKWANLSLRTQNRL